MFHKWQLLVYIHRGYNMVFSPWLCPRLPPMTRWYAFVLALPLLLVSVSLEGCAPDAEPEQQLIASFPSSLDVC